MILHIMKDQKFLDGAYHFFEMVAPGKNEYVVISNSDKLTYIKTFRPRIVSPRVCFSKKFLAGLCAYQAVIIHSLTPKAQRLIDLASAKVNFVWIGWGFDYYNMIYPDRSQLLLPKTQRLHKILSCFSLVNLILYRTGILNHFLNDSEKTVRKQISAADGCFLNVRLLLKFLGKKISRIEKKLHNINRKVEFFAPVLYEDYQLLVQHHRTFEPTYVSWNYGNTSRFIEQAKKCISKPAGQNILFGNSATFTNNHLDAFPLLKHINLNNRRIYCPLSYGEPEYAKVIHREGERIFGRKFIPLHTYLAKDQYEKLLASCSIVIMNHIRQQAVGNINIMLFSGAMVFLRKENTYYQFLKKQGALLFTIDELKTALLQYKNGLSMEQIARNRKIISRNFDNDAIKNKTKNLLKTVGYSP